MQLWLLNAVYSRLLDIITATSVLTGITIMMLTTEASMTDVDRSIPIPTRKYRGFLLTVKTARIRYLLDYLVRLMPKTTCWTIALHRFPFIDTAQLAPTSRTVYRSSPGSNCKHWTKSSTVRGSAQSCSL